MKSSTALAVSVLASAAMAQECNPLLSYYSEMSGNILSGITPINATAVTDVSRSICPNVDGNTCCDDATFGTIRTKFDEGRQSLERQVQNYDRTIELFLSFRRILDKIVKCFPEAKAGIENYDELVKIFDTFEEFAKKTRGQYGTCARALLKVNAGMVCLTCEADTKYITVNNGAAIFNLNTATCDKVGEACAPMLVNVIELAKEFQAGQDSNPFGGSTSKEELDFPCSDSETCKAFVCDAVKASGLQSQLFLIGGNDQETPSETPSIKLPFDENATCDEIRNGFGSRREVHPGLQELLKNTHALTQSLQGKHLRRRDHTSSISGQYTADGYEAVAAGEASSFDTNTFSTPNTATTTGLSALALASSALFAAFF